MAKNKGSAVRFIPAVARDQYGRAKRELAAQNHEGNHMSNKRKRKPTQQEIGEYRAKVRGFLLSVHTHGSIGEAETAIHSLMDGYNAVATQFDLSDMPKRDVTAMWLVTVPAGTADRLLAALHGQFDGNANVDITWAPAWGGHRERIAAIA
jgi:hypothetical protein